MSITFNNEKPIYLQILERLKIDILNGVYQEGTKLPSVRDLAKEYRVNPNTMQRAFNELEDSGLVYAERGNGRFVSENKENLHSIKNQLAHEATKQFLKYMHNLDIREEEMIEMIKKGERTI